MAKLASERFGPVRVTYRDERRLARLGGLDVDAVKADALDRAALRRAMRRCELVFHCVGYVGARPSERVWRVNALAPRLVVEAAGAEGVRRVVLTSSVAGIGPAPAERSGDEQDVYRVGGAGLAYADAKHEGEAEALAAGARAGVEVVVVNPSYVLGPPLDRDSPGETSTRIVGRYLRGRLPAVVDAPANIVDVRDVAKGHMLAAERGAPGERYVLGGHDLTWVELIERVAELSGVRRPLVVLPPASADVAAAAAGLGLPLPVRLEGLALMAESWSYSWRKARRELGYRARPLERTLTDTIAWYLELIEGGRLGGAAPSPLSLAAAGLRMAERVGLLRGLRLAERWTGRRLMVP